MITINEIAREMNLSTATISNALSGKGRVSDAKRQEIIDTATRLGYDFKRLRAVQVRQTVAVFIESLSSIFCTKISEGINRAAEDNGIQVKIYNLDILQKKDNFSPPREWLREKIERIMPQLDASTLGAIYVSQYPRDVTGVMPVTSFPVVYAYCYTNDGAPSVNTDDQQGAYIAVRHLLEIGKKRIAMISGPINSIPMTKRFSGYQRALIASGMSVELSRIRIGDWDISHSCDSMTELLQSSAQPDGVFCQSDHIALGVCESIRRAGLRIPQDIAVVGYDNYDFASFVLPSLTTVDQPLEKIGRVAYSQLRKLMESQEPEMRNILLEARLIRRQST